MSGAYVMSRDALDDMFNDPLFADEPFSKRELLLWMAIRGRVLRCSLPEIAREVGWLPRRVGRVLKQFERAGFILIEGGGAVRTITIMAPVIVTEGTWVGPQTAFHEDMGWKRPERGGRWRGGGISKSIRARVIARDGLVCRWCKTPIVPFHIDHIDPVARGGKDNLANLCVACQRCNLAKGSTSPREWKKRVSEGLA